jgi:barstar (barnase inhibitor)
MRIQRGLLRVDSFDVEAVRREAEQNGFHSFVLSRGIFDRASFFDAVRGTFPLDPPLLGSRSWDALSDSLREGLHTHPSTRIAILWPNARRMAEAAPEDFEIALSVLTDVVEDLANPQLTCGKPKELAVIIEHA